jgi:hypothetical protein
MDRENRKPETKKKAGILNEWIKAASQSIVALVFAESQTNQLLCVLKIFAECITTPSSIRTALKLSR